MKTPIYTDENGKHDYVFSVKMKRLALAYARWEKAADIVWARIERFDWDTVYDAGGFKNADLMADRLSNRFNSAFGAKTTGSSIMYEGEDLETARRCAINHGLGK